MADKKDNYKGPSPAEMYRAAKMIDADIPPIAPSRLKNTDPMIDMLKGTMEAEEAAKQRAAMEKALLSGAGMGAGMGSEMKKGGMKKGGKVKAKSYCRGGGIEVRGKTKGRMV